MNANAGQADIDGDGIGDACDEPVDNGDDSINGEVVNAAEELDNIIAGTNGQTRCIPAGAARRLDQALLSNQWASDSELSESYGSRLFTYMSSALNEIERIADSRRTGATLRADLEALCRTSCEHWPMAE